MYLSIRRVIKETVVIIEAYHFSQGFFLSGVCKFMIVSLPINLVLCFQGNLFITAYIFLIVRISASWSDRPFIMGDTEDKLFCFFYSMAVLDLF